MLRWQKFLAKRPNHSSYELDLVLYILEKTIEGSFGVGSDGREGELAVGTVFVNLDLCNSQQLPYFLREVLQVNLHNQGPRLNCD